jgi:hypothetical protein
MKTVVYLSNGENFEVDADDVAIQQPGMYVLLKAGQKIAIVPMDAAIVHPDGPNRVISAEGPVVDAVVLK